MTATADDLIAEYEHHDGFGFSRANVRILIDAYKAQRALLAEGVDLTKDTPLGDGGNDWWGRAYDAVEAPRVTP